METGKHNPLYFKGRKYEIWSEGYAATGESGGAYKVGEGFGDSFNEAIAEYLQRNPQSTVKLNTRDNFRTEKQYLKQKEICNYNIWGCELFPDEKKARKGFG